MSKKENKKEEKSPENQEVSEISEISENQEVNEINEVTKRYLKAVDDFIEQAKKDVNVIAVIVMGSLTNDVVWEKSDIDTTVVVRDQTLKVYSFSLDYDGIVFNVGVTERSGFVRSLERSRGGSFGQSFMSKAKVMYATDDSITEMVEQSKIIGEKDAQRSATEAACSVVYFIEKCEKWLYVKKDYTYCRYYIVKMAEAIAQLELCMRKEPLSRELFQRVQTLNPELIQRFYYYPMSRDLTGEELEELLKEAENYLAERIDFISAPVLEFLEDGEIKTLNLFRRQFGGDGHFWSHLLDWFAEKGIIEKVSETIRLTPKSRPMFEEIAYISPKALENMKMEI